MSKEGYIPEKKEGESKVVLERLQSYLKEKRSSESSDTSGTYNKPGTSYEHHPQIVPPYEDSSTILKEVLNHKKAELLRQPEVVELLKTISQNLK
ncbi:hypothetical protein JYU34_007623 [Plutella xylostella]|uniref:Uncharacterized protein n=2 Tax=Plutella xylostella TaxID=51655 RepID=A0ABQ7QQV2_PLUXY|nr:hypothetical protein JYU34_007623 [Plutella xylostella]